MKTSIFKICSKSDPTICYVGYTGRCIRTVYIEYLWQWKTFKGKNENKKKWINRIAVFDIFDKGDTCIILLDLIDHETYNDMATILRFHQDSENCINVRKACPDKKAAYKKYIEDNIDIIRKKRKAYYQRTKHIKNSKEMLKLRKDNYHEKKKKIKCPGCGKEIYNHSMRLHVKSQKHLDIISKL